MCSSKNMNEVMLDCIEQHCCLITGARARTTFPPPIFREMNYFTLEREFNPNRIGNCVRKIPLLCVSQVLRSKLHLWSENDKGRGHSIPHIKVRRLD